ncbi:glycosyltransferase [Rhodobacteraceae bacterium R_SAG6]|nr:glycosyltransferase [Rhodobacteraceae bacterium R_SAG6]
MKQHFLSFWAAADAAQAELRTGNSDNARSIVSLARHLANQSPNKEMTDRRHCFLDQLLQTLEQNNVVQYGTSSEGTEQKRILVSGIGRSGTTLLYQQIAKLLLADSRKVNFRYEPYLWNICTAEAKGNPFNMSQLHQYGIMVHTKTPLFLSESHALHDTFVDHLFNGSWDQDTSIRPDAHLTKVIRGSGRLRSYLERYPDIKIVACLRNPMDTINSSLGMFSFFGEEFHVDDRQRFRQELVQRGMDVSQLDCGNLCVEWYAHWWHAFTEETLAIAQDFPANVFLFCYEAFQEAPNSMLDALMAFLGLNNIGMYMGLSKPAGPTIKATCLTQHDIHALRPYTDYYANSVMKSYIGAEATEARSAKMMSRYVNGRFSFPIAGSDMGQKAPIQLRGQILTKGKTPFLQLANCPAHPIKMEDQISRHHGEDPSVLYSPVKNEDVIKCGKRFGVVITCFNNANTITAAVLSCLHQTLPFDEIVIVNDKSTDASAELLGELEARYSSIRVLNLEANLGPSAARDLGIRFLTTDFFSQLDGDDLYWPTKNAEEARAVAGDEGVVAFSDILLVQPQKSFIQNCAAYDKKSGVSVWEALLSRTSQVPRDMTVSRNLYFDAGGYDMTRHIYEDWDLKLRLSAKSRLWVKANCTAGTIYNRISPGLSSVDDGSHARALCEIFLKSAVLAKIPTGSLLPSFDAALGRFGERHVAKRSRMALSACVSKGGNLSRLAAVATSRINHGTDNATFIKAVDAFVKQTNQIKVPA